MAVNYVVYDVSNYLAQSKAEWAKTNFEEYVDAYYRQNAAQYADAKTPDEAKVKVRELLVRNRALMDARQSANEFANPLFALEPAKAENLISAAKAKGLTVHTTAPFAANAGPMDFDAPAAFTKEAFKLSADEPFAGPIIGPDGVYIIALAQDLPSAIPPLDAIQSRVLSDFKEQQALALAQRDGTNFYYNATVQMATGKTFAQVAIATGQSPQVLPPFSLSSTEVAGFTQAYRTLASESLLGSVAGSTYNILGVSLEQKLPTRTYLGFEFDDLEQKVDRTIGVFDFPARAGAGELGAWAGS